MICPRHGSAFDLETGSPLSLPAYEPVATYPVRVEDGIVKVEVAIEPLLGDDRRAVQRLPRRGVGPPGPRRARPLRAALPRGLPVGALVADDPAQARGLPGGVRGLRPRPGRGVRRARRRAAARRRRRSSATAARSRRRSRTRGRRSPCARPEPLHELFWAYAPERHEAPRARGLARLDAGVDGALEAAEAARLPVRRPDDGLRGHAGLRRRQRPSGRLLGAGGRRGRAGSTSVLTDAVDFRLTAERRWSGVGDFKYGQWRYQLVEVCPRDLTGNRLASVGDSRERAAVIGRKRLYEVQAGIRTEGPRKGPFVFLEPAR